MYDQDLFGLAIPAVDTAVWLDHRRLGQPAGSNGCGEFVCQKLLQLLHEHLYDDDWQYAIGPIRLFYRRDGTQEQATLWLSHQLWLLQELLEDKLGPAELTQERWQESIEFCLHVSRIARSAILREGLDRRWGCV